MSLPAVRIHKPVPNHFPDVFWRVVRHELFALVMVRLILIMLTLFGLTLA